MSADSTRAATNRERSARRTASTPEPIRKDTMRSLLVLGGGTAGTMIATSCGTGV